MPFVSRQLRRQPLDRDRPLELLIARTIDLPHPSGADAVGNLVAIRERSAQVFQGNIREEVGATGNDRALQ